MTSVFITGATGYIGGQALKDLVAHRREYAIRALVRDSQGAKKVTEQFPQVQIVSGTLDDVALIEEEAAKAGIVLNLASNKHMDSLKAIHRGLVKSESPAYLIQVSGASALAAAELASGSFQPGEPSAEIFDDVEDIGKIRSLIRAHPSRAVDNFVLDVAEKHISIRTAIVFPPLIYGEGGGPVNRRSIQLPALARVTLERGRGVRVGKGLSRWGNVHIRDLSKIIAELADAAANGCKVPAVWGENGVYFPSTGEISFGELAKQVAQVAHRQGLIKTEEVEEAVEPLASQLLPGGAVFFGTNARIKSRRAVEELSWSPTHVDLDHEIFRVVSDEAARR